jgi:molybdate/tungstate transport system permease protein
MMTKRPKTTFIVFGLLGGLLLLDLVVPIANLLIRADWSGWTAAFLEHGAARALGVSALTSALAVGIMTLLGVPLGYLLARGRLPFARFWIGLVFLPMAVPDLAGGILLLQTFGPYGTIGRPLDAWNIALTNNMAGIVLAQLFVAAPFVIISAVAGFSGVDSKLEMAAATLGDSQWDIFRRISLPLAWPSIAAGVTLAWIRALGEFGATLIVAYNPFTLPVYMWVKFESNGLAGALPMAFLLVCLAATAVAVSMLFSRLTGYSDAVAVLGDAPSRLI